MHGVCRTRRELKQREGERRRREGEQQQREGERRRREEELKSVRGVRDDIVRLSSPCDGGRHQCGTASLFIMLPGDYFPCPSAGAIDFMRSCMSAMFLSKTFCWSGVSTER